MTPAARREITVVRIGPENALMPGSYYAEGQGLTFFMLNGDDMAMEYNEKRHHNRVPLDIPLFILLQTPEATELPVQLLNCSRGGAQLAFAPKDEEYSRSMLNREVSLKHLPKCMDPVDSGKEGKVAWVCAGRCGVRFTEPLLLTDGELREVSDDL